MSFEKLGLSIELLRAISDKGYLNPTPVQRQAIPPILKGQDVVVTAQTGTGKTAAFTLPLLQCLHKLKKQPEKVKKRPIQALILTPTRELAAQVFENVQAYSKYLPFKSTVVHGGVSINPQIRKLKRGVDILVATPGRLLDLVHQNIVDLTKIEIFVLDEADRMLDMGFIHDIRKVLKLLPWRRQNLLFSATFPQEIKELTNRLLSSPTRVQVASGTTTAERVAQVIYPVDRSRKRELLSFIVGSKNWRQVLVFVRTKHGANRLAQQLENDGLPSAAIHGNKTQGARTRALAAFKEGKIRVLVATDIAARGIDIDKLPHVVNFDLPSVPEDYVHRVGRTGRASNEGLAVSLMCIDERKLLKEIEKLLRCKIPEEVIPGYEPNPEIKAGPTQTRRNARGGNRTNKSIPNRNPRNQRARQRASQLMPVS